jgi:hypothetical protein
MAKYDPTHPALCLHGIANSIEVAGQYDEQDETGLYGKNMSYIINITGISAQDINDESVRTANLYTGIDVKAGDWLSIDSGKKVLNIINVIEKGNDSITALIEDVDGINYRQYGQNNIETSETVIIFELSENGIPVLVGDAAEMFKEGAIDLLQSRFSIDEQDERFRLDHDIAPNVNIGDIVGVNSDGNLVKHGSSDCSEIPVGSVISTARNGKSVYIKPFNKIIDNYPNPKILSGNPKQTYYTDPLNPGEISTTKKFGSKPVYLHLRDSIPTEVNSNSSTTLPDSDDVIILNNVEVYNGPNGDSVTDVTSLKDLINQSSNFTNITASTFFDNVSVETATESLRTGIGQCVSLISGDGGANFTYPSATFNDGNSSVSITFNPYNYSLNPVAYGGDATFLVITATEIAQILNTEFLNNNINLFASTFTGPGGQSYPFLKIEALNGADILITNGNVDAFSTNFADTNSITGLNLTTNASSDLFLKLTRLDGGDILITGGTDVGGVVKPNGGYINQNGICSSSSGRAALILMIEGSSESTSTGGGVTEIGLNVNIDHDLSPNITNTTNRATGCYITYTPFLGSRVEVRVNGIDANLGDSSNYDTKSCYFSPNGLIIRDLDTINAGDQLYWNGDVAGFELDGSDDIDFLYQTSSNNLS